MTDRSLILPCPLLPHINFLQLQCFPKHSRKPGRCTSASRSHGWLLTNAEHWCSVGGQGTVPATIQTSTVTRKIDLKTDDNRFQISSDFLLSLIQLSTCSCNSGSRYVAPTDTLTQDFTDGAESWNIS